MVDEIKRTTLNKVIGAKEVITLAFGAMIGWGWIIMCGFWVESAGLGGTILALFLGGVMAVFVGFAYSELTPALPLAGGELCFAYRAMGYRGAWITGWAITFAYIAVATWEAPAMATAIDYLFGLPRAGYLWTIAGFDVYISWVLVGSITCIIIAFLNYIGIKAASIFQFLATVAMAIGGLFFLFGSLIAGDPINIGPFFTNKSAFITVLMMMPAYYVGFDVIPQAAEEMKLPLKKIPGLIILSIGMCFAWLALMSVGVAFAGPSELRATANIPVADAFAFAMGGPVFGKIVILTAILGILTSWNAFFIGAARVIFAMGRAKMLPEVFARLHPKYKSPYAAVFLVFLVVFFGPLLGKAALAYIIDACSLGTTVAYLMVALSFFILRYKEPEMRRPCMIKYGKVIGIIAVLTAAGFTILYLPFGPGALLAREYAMVGGWCLLGVIFYIMAALKYKDVTAEEREFLMFGDEYKRDILSIGKGRDYQK
jgi:amino acid transporter